MGAARWRALLVGTRDALKDFPYAGELPEVPMYDFRDTARTVVASLLLTSVATIAFVGGSALLSALSSF
jgi:hypothetical protein